MDQCGLFVSGSIASTNVEIVPSWENPPPYKGRSAHCAPMLLEPHMAPLRQSSPIPSNTSIRPSISHLYNQHQPLLQAGSGLNIAPHHTSTSSHAFPAVSQMGHVHNNFGAEPGHRAHTHQRKQSFGGLSAQSVANHPLMPPFVNQPALYSSSAETFMPTYGMVLPNCSMYALWVEAMRSSHHLFWTYMLQLRAASQTT